MSDKKQKRQYRKITPRVVALHEAQQLLSGNATAAVRVLEQPDNASDGAIRQRAVRIVAKRDNEDAAGYIEKQLQQIGVAAIDRVQELVLSEDERIATKNSHYVIDHLRGKAVQRSISVTGKLNIQSVLD